MNEKTDPVLVTGANGFVGSTVMRELAARGLPAEGHGRVAGPGSRAAFCGCPRSRPGRPAR